MNRQFDKANCPTCEYELDQKRVSTATIILRIVYSCAFWHAHVHVVLERCVCRKGTVTAAGALL